MGLKHRLLASSSHDLLSVVLTFDRPAEGSLASEGYVSDSAPVADELSGKALARAIETARRANIEKVGIPDRFLHSAARRRAATTGETQHHVA